MRAGAGTTGVVLGPQALCWERRRPRLLIAC